MKTTNYLASVLSVLAALAIFSGTAFADTKTFTNVLAPTDVSALANDNFTLQGFDTTLGTLTSVTLSLKLDTSASVSVINITGSAQSFTNASSAFVLTLTDPDSSTLQQDFGSSVPAGVVNPGLTTEPATVNPSILSLSIVPANLSTYEVSGTQNLNFNLSVPAGLFKITAPSGVLVSGDGTVSAATTVTYTYTDAVAVPEPTTTDLIALAFGALVFIRARAFRKANSV